MAEGTEDAREEAREEAREDAEDRLGIFSEGGADGALFAGEGDLAKEVFEGLVGEVSGSVVAGRGGCEDLAIAPPPVTDEGLFGEVDASFLAARRGERRRDDCFGVS